MTEGKPKILWHSNAPWAPTGYGQQTGLFAPEIHKTYDVAISGFYGIEGSRLMWGDNIPVYPGLGGEFGNEYLIEHAARHFGGDPRGGLVLTLMDVWVLEPQMLANVNAACWVPVDHEPAPPAVVQFFHRSDAVPIAMSRFGQEQLNQYGLDALYMPHGVDTQAFRPYERREVRRLTGVPEDAFLVGMVAANKGRPSRKGFQQALEAFRLFRERHDNAFLYLHTVTNPNIAQGENLPALIAALGIPDDAVLIADQYRLLFDPYPPKTMAKILSSLDVLLNCAQGEGFGIPVLEAQACGVPVIVTDFSAMKEVGKVGWQVRSRPVWTGQNSWQAIADVDDIVVALNHCYALPKAARKQLSEQARKHALTYDVQRVLEEHMLPALGQAAQRFEDRKPVELVEPLRAAA